MALSGFGLGPFGVMTIGVPVAPLPAENDGQIGGARKIDPQTKRLVQVQDGTGAFAAMSDVLQRAYLLLAFGAKSSPKITANYATDTEEQVRSALKPLTDGRSPVVEIVTVSAIDNGRSATFFTVTLKDLQTNQIVTVAPKR